MCVEADFGIVIKDTIQFPIYLFIDIWVSKCIENISHTSNCRILTKDYQWLTSFKLLYVYQNSSTAEKYAKFIVFIKIIVFKIHQVAKVAQIVKFTQFWQPCNKKAVKNDLKLVSFALVVFVSEFWLIVHNYSQRTLSALGFMKKINPKTRIFLTSEIENLYKRYLFASGEDILHNSLLFNFFSQFFSF